MAGRIFLTLPTCPSVSRTLMPWGWRADRVRRSLTKPRVSFPVRWSFFKTIPTSVPGTMSRRFFPSIPQISFLKRSGAAPTASGGLFIFHPAGAQRVALLGAEHGLAQAHRPGRDLHQLVFTNKVDGLLQGKRYNG